MLTMFWALVFVTACVTCGWLFAIAGLFMALLLLILATRDAELIWTLMFVALSVVCSWLLGTAGLSLAWLLFLLALVVAVWKSSLVKLVEAAVKYETLRVRRKRVHNQDETAEWFNFLFNRWWVFSSPSLFIILKEHLEPILNEAKPSFVESLELRQFTLGEQTPYVKAVRVFDVHQGKRIPLSARSLQQPPGGLAQSVHHQVALEADICLDSDDFRMVIRTRLFGKGVGMDLDLAMEKLNVTGKIYATLTLNMEAPFPHITHLNLTFIEKPEVWFSVRVLKSVQMMEVPVLKTWIHSLVMDALVTALVDPGKLDVNLTSHDRPTPGQEIGDTVAQGVLTVTLSAMQPGHMPEDVRWLVLTLGEQRQKTSQLSPRWQESPSFLINSLQTDRLVVKLKSKRLVSSITLAQFELPLSNYNLDSVHIVETVLHKKQARSGSSNFPNISVRLEYTALSPIQLDQPEMPWPIPQAGRGGSSPVSGVIFVFIHGAEGLTIGDQSECNPYCMLFNSRKKVKTTHYLRGTANPQWESRTQFLVSDFTQVSLSFVVCSWSPNKMADTDLLGLAIFTMNQNETWQVHHQLQLSGNTSPAFITVSVVFHPVPSVAQSELCFHDSVAPLGADDDDLLSYNHGKRNSITWMQQAKMLLTHRDQDTSASDISNLLSNGMGLMEVSIIRAHDLVSKDLNGFSDPYCELKVNGECKYKSSIKKKTLNPIWEENSIMGLPRAGETLEVVLWDYDTFGMKDFLGNVTLTLEDIRKASNSDTSQSYQLQGVKTGAVEIKVKVISEETESQCYQPSINSSTSSPRLPNRHEPDGLSRLPSGERSKLRLHIENLPPPAPPRTVTLGYKPHPPEGDLLREPLGNSISNGNISPTQSSSSSLHSVPRVTVTDLHNPPHLAVAVPELPNMSAGGGGQRSPRASLTPSPDSQFKKNVPECSSFRNMKLKMKRGLKLRRFKSEVSVHEEKSGVTNGKPSTTTTLSIEPSGGGESDATELLQMEGLSHAVSQPNIPHIKQPSPRLKNKRPTDLKVSAPVRPDIYFGVEGKVIQAQGLHVAHVAQLYCRIKLQSATSPNKLTRVGSNAAGKTLAKSRLIPAMPNPQFDLGFQLDNPENVPRQAALVFEIRSSGKELVAARRITLQDMLSAASPDTNEVHTWLALNNGASLEVEISHSRELKKQSRKIFRSWSVHRIGKI
ncbi:uncharacterized protein PYUK71.03c-like isoform X2 [Zootermopsis nevadensis]|uniref:uncharacterized protein PYUK71.03c-like isoform X2 n=1 Tax=Zootermopsis nevadensis TaxID=136037 RepID=UPI000B8E31F7|nr:uncharacterized protein PYUK71.03c-like isoform X2 [Zootermopsis nevadensis]